MHRVLTLRVYINLRLAGLPPGSKNLEIVLNLKNDFQDLEKVF